MSRRSSVPAVCCPHWIYGIYWWMAGPSRRVVVLQEMMALVVNQIPSFEWLKLSQMIIFQNSRWRDFGVHSILDNLSLSIDIFGGNSTATVECNDCGYNPRNQVRESRQNQSKTSKLQKIFERRCGKPSSITKPHNVFTDLNRTHYIKIWLRAFSEARTYNKPAETRGPGIPPLPTSLGVKDTPRAPEIGPVWRIEVLAKKLCAFLRSGQIYNHM